MNGTVDKQLRAPVRDQYAEVRGLRYNREYGTVAGNTIEVMILVTAGDEYPADLVVSHRIRNPSLAEKATKTFGPLPSIVPGLHTEAAADLMANASTDMRSSAASVVQLLWMSLNAEVKAVLPQQDRVIPEELQGTCW